MEITSLGFNGKPLSGKATYSAGIACNLKSKKGAAEYQFYGKKLEDHPYITQESEDGTVQNNQYIANMQDGAEAGFKYFDLTDTTSIAVTARLNRSKQGKIIVLDGTKKVLAQIDVSGKTFVTSRGEVIKQPEQIEKTALYFIYHGVGSCDMKEFTLM